MSEWENHFSSTPSCIKEEKPVFSYYFINFTILRLFSSSQMIVKSTAKGRVLSEHFLLRFRIIYFYFIKIATLSTFSLCSGPSTVISRHTLDNDEVFDIHLKIETNENSASYRRQRLHFLFREDFLLIDPRRPRSTSATLKMWMSLSRGDVQALIKNILANPLISAAQPDSALDRKVEELVAFALTLKSCSVDFAGVWITTGL